MKITFEFDTDKEGFDYTELERYKHVDKLAQCISQIQDKLRGWYKYDERSAIPTEEICDTLYEIINDNVNMEDMGY